MPDFYLLPDEIPASSPRHDRKLLGQKPPLKPREVWAIRIRLQIQGYKRDLALFNLAIVSKLRSCDLVALRVQDICLAGRVKDRAVIIQKKTHRPVQFELTEQSRQAAQAWIVERGLRDEDAVQLLLGHTKLESTVRYLGIEVDDALQISEQVEL